MPDEPKDPVPDLLAAFDQLGAAMRPVADFMANYHGSLIEAGLPPLIAAKLVEQLHDRALGMMMPPPNPLAGLFGMGQ